MSVAEKNILQKICEEQRTEIERLGRELHLIISGSNDWQLEDSYLTGSGFSARYRHNGSGKVFYYSRESGDETFNIKY